MSSTAILRPNFVPACDIVYDAQIKTFANWSNQKSRMHSLTVPRDLSRRRVWHVIDEVTAGAGALNVAGGITFYLGGTLVCKIPFIQAGGIDAFGWNPNISGGPTEVVGFRFAGGNVVTGNAFTVNVVCDKVQVEYDTFTYTVAGNIGSALMVASEYPQ